MAAEQASLLDFPCRFPIKVFGLRQEDFRALVIDIVERHAGPLPADAVAERSSRGGRYTAVTVTITARSRAQLDALYGELSAHQRISMVL